MAAGAPCGGKRIDGKITCAWHSVECRGRRVVQVVMRVSQREHVIHQLMHRVLGVGMTEYNVNMVVWSARGSSQFIL